MKPSIANELFTGLRALEEAMFPKRCASCGRVYKTLDDFLERTHSIVGSSGLVAVPKRRKVSMIGVFRNCVCRSTLLVTCEDRRGGTAHQRKRRLIFGNLLDILEKSGWTRAEARKEILNLMHGKKSRIMDAVALCVPAFSPDTVHRDA